MRGAWLKTSNLGGQLLSRVLIIHGIVGGGVSE